jgi:hypothetical protein
MIEPWYTVDGLSVEQALASDPKAIFAVTLQRGDHIRALVIRLSVTWYVGSAMVIGGAIAVLLAWP